MLAFETYIERAAACGMLDLASCDALRRETTLAGEERDERITSILERSLRGMECEVVGITGRHPRGWWGDGSIARVPHSTADDNEACAGAPLAPGTLPCYVELSRPGCPVDAEPDVALLTLKVTNLRLRRPVQQIPPRLRIEAHRNHDLDAPNVWELEVPLGVIEKATALFESGGLAARCAELMASNEWHARFQTPSGNFFAMWARGPLTQHGLAGVQGLAGDWISDLVWVSVDDSETYETFVSLFHELGVERHLQDKCDLSARLRVYSAFFVVRTECVAPYFHTDWSVDVGTNAFTLSKRVPLARSCAPQAVIRHLHV